MAAVDAASVHDLPAHDVPARRARPAVAAERDEIRARIRVAAIGFLVLYLIIVGRLVSFGLADPAPKQAWIDPNAAIEMSRPDIVDRNGEILAADIDMSSLYAEPRNIVDPDEAAEAITSVLTDLDVGKLRDHLSGNAGFWWVKREITPAQRAAIHALGVPGLYFKTETRRFYPGGSTAAHIIGLTDIDSHGIAGIEKTVDDRGFRALQDAGLAIDAQLQPVALSLDLRVQHILHDELSKAMERYRAIAAGGVVLNVNTGEVVALASLPDYDPNNPNGAGEARLNRMVTGVYELGSVFKSFTFAMALDAGVVTMDDMIDATKPIRIGGFSIDDFHAKYRMLSVPEVFIYSSNIGGFSIDDFHAKYRMLSVPEVFIYSSNIGAARMAMMVGPDGQRAFMDKLGMFNPVSPDLPERGHPIVPKKWSDITAMTVAFGHGLAVTPLQVAVADAAILNGGKLIPPTLLPRDEADAAALAQRVVSERTSEQMRYLMRLNVLKGSGRNADVPGYMVGGKTGTAEKVVNGRYSSSKRLNSFLASFPIDDPQYVVLVMLDEPKAPPEGGGVTAGSNAAPTVGAVIRRAAGILGVRPRTEEEANALMASN